MLRSLLLSAVVFLAPPAFGESPIAGKWVGVVEGTPEPIYLEADLLVEDNTCFATLDVPLQQQPLPYRSQHPCGGEGKVVFSTPGVPCDSLYEGQQDPDGHIRGVCHQGGKHYPFHLTPSANMNVPLDQVVERDIQVGQAPFVLSGTLSTPRGKGSWPAVVLVHGSGPSDRNEKIGPSQPFRDVAWGLAKMGMAVIRYDKRTLLYGPVCASDKKLTVKEETIDDAVWAVKWACSAPEVDKARVYVLGHSLGGYLLPRILNAAPEAAGGISLAGPARPLEDLILEQVINQGMPKSAIADKQGEVGKIKQLTSKEVSDGLAFLGIPAAYWLDLKHYSPVKMAQSLHKPLLFLQGESDCQVSMRDFALWQTALKDNANVQCQSFPKLNHLFMKVDGVSTFNEYFKPGQKVEQTVIDEIACWINGAKTCH